MLRLVVSAGLAVSGLVNAALSGFFFWRFVSPYQPPPPNVSYLDSQLAVLEVILAAVTLAMGLIALFGYGVLRQAAETQARKTADRVAREVADPRAKEVAEEKISAFLAGLDVIGFRQTAELAGKQSENTLDILQKMAGALDRIERSARRPAGGARRGRKPTSARATKEIE